MGIEHSWVHAMKRLKGRIGALPSSGLFFQKSFEGLPEDASGVSTPTVFPPAVARLFLAVFFCLMVFTEQTRLDNHDYLRFLGLLGLLGLLGHCVCCSTEPTDYKKPFTV